MCANYGFPRVIAFFGPDGAGKSTQAELLVNFLTARGLRVKRAWVRSTHTFAYLLWMLFYKLNLCDDRSGMLKRMRMGFAVSYLNEKDYGAVSPITMSPPILKGSLSRWIWATIEVISIVPVVVLQVYLPLLLGRVVVAERFIVDSIASIAYFLGDEGFAKSWHARFLLRLIPKGTIFVFVDADYGTILSRRKEVAGPLEYTEFHRRLFRKLTKVVGAVYIDTSRLSIKEAHQSILGFIGKRMN
jgi:thymidylate kinase